jgi:hypothetical protein
VSHSLELLPDDASDRRLRAQWDALDAAGLEALSRHRSPSNRPHVTVASVVHLPDGAVPRLAALLAESLPVEVRLGPPLVLGPGPRVLARSLVPDPALLRLHAEAARVLGVPPDSRYASGRWVPHLSLARRLSDPEVGKALGVLAADEGTVVGFTRGRLWDGDARAETDLTSPFPG